MNRTEKMRFLAVRMIAGLAGDWNTGATRSISNVTWTAKEAAGFIMEKAFEHSRLRRQGKGRGREARYLCNKGRVEDRKAPKTTESGTETHILREHMVFRQEGERRDLASLTCLDAGTKRWSVHFTGPRRRFARLSSKRRPSAGSGRHPQPPHRRRIMSTR